MRRAAIRVFAAAAVLALGACNSFNGALRGEPNFDVRILVAPEAAMAIGQAITAGITFSPPIAMTRPQVCNLAFVSINEQAYRDACIQDLISIIDAQYAEYKRSLLNIVNDFHLGENLLTIALGQAIALAPGKTEKSILGAVSAGVAGARTAVDTELLYQASIVALINQMDTDRATQDCTILARQKNPTPPSAPPPATATKLSVTTMTTVKGANSQMPAPKPSILTTEVAADPPASYSMRQASVDLLQYYEAGTFTHALQSLQAKTGSQATKAKQQVTNQKTGASGAPDSGAGVTTVVTTTNGCPA